jgi:hypothetical protein
MDPSIDISDVPELAPAQLDSDAAKKMDLCLVVALFKRLPFPGEKGYDNSDDLKVCLVTRRDINKLNQYRDMSTTNILITRMIVYLLDLYINMTPENAVKFAQFCIECSKAVPGAIEFAVNVFANFVLDNMYDRIACIFNITIPLQERETPEREFMTNLLDCLINNSDHPDHAVASSFVLLERAYSLQGTTE